MYRSSWRVITLDLPVIGLSDVCPVCIVASSSLQKPKVLAIKAWVDPIYIIPMVCSCSSDVSRNCYFLFYLDSISTCYSGLLYPEISVLQWSGLFWPLVYMYKSKVKFVLFNDATGTH